MEKEEKEKIKEEIKEEIKKEKKSKGLIILVILLSLIIVGLIVFLLIDKGVFGSKKEKEEDKKPNTDISELSNNDLDYMKDLSNTLFLSTGGEFIFNDLDNQTKLSILLTLSDKNIEEVKGSELVKIAKKYFGEDSKVNLEDILCIGHTESEVKGSNVLYIYNEDSDSFKYNEKHPGHGGLGSGVGPTIIFDNVTRSDDEYYITVGVYYQNSECYDICPPLGKTHGKIYKTKEDALNKTNALIDAAENDNLYTKGVFVDEEYGYEYKYDSEKIYEIVKDLVNKYKFTFKKVDGNYIFIKAELVK